MLTLFVEKLSVLACKWFSLIVMKCINTIKQGVNYANNSQMPFTASIKYFAPVPSARGKPIKNRNRSQLGVSTNHSPDPCVKYRVKRYSNNRKVSLFLILFLSRKVQFASRDTKTITPLNITSSRP